MYGIASARISALSAGAMSSMEDSCRSDMAGRFFSQMEQVDRKHGELYSQEARACGALTGFGRRRDLHRTMPVATLCHAPGGNRKSGDFRPVSGIRSCVRITPFTYRRTPVSGRFFRRPLSFSDLRVTRARLWPADDSARPVAVVQLGPDVAPKRGAGGGAPASHETEIR